MVMKNYIKEDYCSYEVAKLLKEKGFNEPCYRWYNGNGDICAKFITPDVPLNYFSRERYLCTTHQMAMKWLRETLGLYITIRTMFIEKEVMHDSVIQYMKNNKHNTITDENSYNKIEEATEAAIKYCLENLESLIWK